mmetsp:Transcript_22313/g.35567  ORF Transcript_22313/g.35567 Transcript_22313/m.35567 type:complete len:206 (-) Transcript_22313:2942-3559(-)
MAQTPGRKRHQSAIRQADMHTAKGPPRIARRHDLAQTEHRINQPDRSDDEANQKGGNGGQRQPTACPHDVRRERIAQQQQAFKFARFHLEPAIEVVGDNHVRQRHIHARTQQSRLRRTQPKDQKGRKDDGQKDRVQQQQLGCVGVPQPGVVQDKTGGAPQHEGHQKEDIGIEKGVEDDITRYHFSTSDPRVPGFAPMPLRSGCRH